MITGRRLSEVGETASQVDVTVSELSELNAAETLEAMFLAVTGVTGS